MGANARAIFRSRGARRRAKSASGDQSFVRLAGLAQHIASAPDRLDVVAATACVRELLAQLTDEDVDDLQFRLVHAAIEMIQKHFLAERRSLAQSENFKNLIFLAGQMHPRAASLDTLLLEVDDEVADAN
jgi:hypothetical protein